MSRGWRNLTCSSPRVSRFNASSRAIVAKMFGAFEALAQYENKQCGGTTTYYSQGQGQGHLGQLSPLPVSE